MDEASSHVPTTPKLRVFVSSRMQELAPERAALKAALASAGLDSFVFEDDAGARPQGIRDTYLDEIESADLYLGVFWCGYGAYTIEEFEHAQTLGLDCLVFEKHSGDAREPPLQAFLDRIGAVETGAVTPDRFTTIEELARKALAAVTRWREGFDAEQRRRKVRTVVHGVPGRTPPHFVGREALLADAARRLRAGEDVALEGLPGAGKTTLATALVWHRGVVRRFRDGVLWASLGPQADPTAVLLEWAEALDESGALAREIGASGALWAQSELLQRALADRVMLVVIDDVWQADAARALRCGGPRCAHLLTTRDKGVARAFLGHDGATTLAELDDAAAFALLQRLAPQACAAHEAAARSLVRAVGGLPQAVRLIGGQLATAQAGLFAAVFPELGDEAFAELADPAERLRLAEKRLGARGQAAVTLRDTVLMSLQGLPDEAHQAFFALAAFAPKPERFDRAAAEAVTGAPARALALLATRHLLDIESTPPSLALHPTVADVGRSGAGAAIERHRGHYLQALADAGDDWRRIQALHGQLRWAWQQATGDAPFELLVRLERYQQQRGLVGERLAWARRCLALAQERALPAAVLGGLHKIIGRALSQAGHHEQAVASLREVHALALQVDQPQPGIDASFDLAVTLARSGAAEAALALLTQALAGARAIGDRRREAEALMCTAVVLRNQGRADEAMPPVLQALSLLHELGDQPNQADAHALIASIHLRAAAGASALEHLGQAQALRRSLGQKQADAELMTGAALVHLDAGRLAPADEAAAQALAAAESSGDLPGQIDALDVLGDVQRSRGDTVQALLSYQRELELARSAGLDSSVANAHESIALAWERSGQPAQALAAATEALALRRATGNLVRQALVLAAMARHHLRLAQPDAAVQCRAQAWECHRQRGNNGAATRALDELVRTPSLLDAPVQRVQALDAVIMVLQASPADDAAAASHCARLARRRGDVRRYGAALLLRRPWITPVVLRLGAQPPVPPAIEQAMADVSIGLTLAYGWTFPRIEVLTAQPGLASDEAALVIRATVRAVRQSVQDQVEVLANEVAQALRDELADFVGHDELLLELGAQPTLAARLRASPLEASILVAVLHTLLEERVPLTELAAIVRCFEALRASGADRLAIVAAVRQLPAVKPLLPGNGSDCRYLHLASHWQQEVAAALRVERAMPYVAFEPARTQALLGALRSTLAGVPGLVQAAVLVEDAAVRRYVQRLVGLEYPRLSVLARDELVGSAEGRIVGTIDGPPVTPPRPIGAQAAVVAPRPAATPRPDLRSGGRHAERRVELLGAAPHLDPAVGVAEALLPALDDALFDELGLLMPPLCCVVDPQLTPGRFQVRLNGLRWPAQSGDGAARVQALCAVVRAEAKHLLDEDAVRCLLDLLHEAHPVLVEATRQRFDLPLLTDLLRTLLGDAVPIRDLRAILEALLAVRGHQSPPPGADEASLRLDAAGYERELRNALRHVICAPLSSDGVMHVHELASTLQARLQGAASPWDDPALFEAVAHAVEEDRSAGRACVLLVADALRRPLREATRRAVAGVAVLAYDDLHMALNIQPGRAIEA